MRALVALLLAAPSVATAAPMRLQVATGTESTSMPFDFSETFQPYAPTVSAELGWWWGDVWRIGLGPELGFYVHPGFQAGIWGGGFVTGAVNPAGGFLIELRIGLGVMANPWLKPGWHQGDDGEWTSGPSTLLHAYASVGLGLGWELDSGVAILLRYDIVPVFPLESLHTVLQIGVRIPIGRPR